MKRRCAKPVCWNAAVRDVEGAWCRAHIEKQAKQDLEEHMKEFKSGYLTQGDKTILTRTQVLLDLSEIISGFVYFLMVPDPGEVAEPFVVTLPYSTYQEMGKPQQITVTVQPGDRLNVLGAI